MIKGVQLFVHRYYGAIKLLMQFITIALLIFLIQYAVDLSNRGDDARRQLILEITQSIQKETREQTETLNKQLQALCVIVLQTSGEQALRQLDAEIQNKCKALADGGTPESTGTAPTSTQTQQQTQQQNVQQSPPEATTPPPAKQPETSAPPEPRGLRRVKVVDDTLKLLGL